jgi:hypothetical protein
MHTNKHNYIDQMVNREVLERVHERMNDELVATAKAANFADLEEGESTGLGTTRCVNPRMDSEDVPDDWCHISQDQSQKIYLPRFLNKSQNAADPAFKVSTGGMQVYSEFRTLSNPHIRTFIPNS